MPEMAGREPRMPPPEDEPARHAPAARPGPGRDADIARCLGVLHSVVAHSFLAGFALANVRTGVCREAAVSVDHALGQLDEIVRGVHDAALQLKRADARIRSAGPAEVSESGTA
jgi:hypothetical protein